MFKLKITAAFVVTFFASHLLVVNAGNPVIDHARQFPPTNISEPEQVIKCSVEAYRRGMHNENVPPLTNIRSQANKNSKIVKAISTTDEVVFFITGNSNGWFEISKVETIGTDDDKAIFQGRGWVHSSQLDLSVAGGDTKLYAEPRKNSRIVKKLIVDASPAEPLACQGTWMKVKSGRHIGWLSPAGQCANPLTTCP